MINAVDNRDISMLYLFGVYILSIVDAYAGAHLFDFKILDYNMRFDFIASSTYPSNSNVGIKFSFSIKK